MQLACQNPFRIRDAPADRQARDVVDGDVHKALFQLGTQISLATVKATGKAIAVADRGSHPRSRGSDLLQCSNER